MRVPRVYINAILSELRGASKEERKLLLLPVFAWVKWYKNGERALPKYLTGAGTYYTKLVAKAEIDYNIPPAPPENLSRDVANLLKLARRNLPLDVALV